jgi:hypothetical protein
MWLKNQLLKAWQREKTLKKLIGKVSKAEVQKLEFKINQFRDQEG